MPRTIGEALVRVRPDTKGLGTEIGKKAEKETTSAFKKLGAAAGVALGSAVVAGLGKSIGAARDLAETQSAVAQIFGKSSDAVLKFSETTARAFGLSKQAALDGANTFATFGKSAGLSGDQLVKFSTKMVGLSSDLASFKNTSPEEAIDAIGAALRGEAEPIRRYGVLLDQATLEAEAMRIGLVKAKGDTEKIGIAQQRAEIAQRNYNTAVKEHGKDSIEAQRAEVALTASKRSLADATKGTIPPLTQSQKVLAAQSSILRQTKDAQGDFARTSGGLANQQRILKAQIQNTAATVGGALLPALLSIVKAFSQSVTWIQANTSWLKPLTLAVGSLVAVIYVLNAATKAAAAIQTAWKAITAASTIVTKVATVTMRAFGVAIRFAGGPITLIITAISALVAVIIYLYKHNETARRIIDGAWKGIKIAIQAVGDWFTKVLWPSLKRAFDQLMVAVKFLVSVWKFEFNVLKTVVLAVVHAVVASFNAVKNFITVTLPNAFKAGVAAIGKWWHGLRDAAKEPVKFVVKYVINPFLSGFQKIAGVFGVKTPDPIKGFAEGGKVPGPSSTRDNRWAFLRDKRGNVLGRAGLATGEFVVNARDTAKALPLLQWINAGMRRGKTTEILGRRLADRPGDGSEGWGFASGGLVGFFSDIWKAISDPVALVKKPFEAMLAQIPGGGAIRDVLIGMGKRLIGGVVGMLTTGVGTSVQGAINVAKAVSFLRAQNGKPYIWASAGPNGYDCSGIVSAVYNVLHGKNPYNHTFSTASLPNGWFPKPGIGGPLTAAWSHPGQRGASSSVGHMMGMVGGVTFESSGSRGVHLGGTTRRLTDFARIGHYDLGGRWPSGTLGLNASGRTEYVSSGDAMDRLIDLARQQLAAILELGNDIADALHSSTRRAIHLGRGHNVIAGARI